MPKNIIGPSPYPIKVIDTDAPIRLEDLMKQMVDHVGITLCVRSACGHEQRGGYFFHFCKSGDSFELLDFGGRKIDIVDADKLLRFINHASGRLFDAEMLEYCQTVINFRQDQITTD